MTSNVSRRIWRVFVNTGCGSHGRRKRQTHGCTAMGSPILIAGTPALSRNGGACFPGCCRTVLGTCRTQWKCYTKVMLKTVRVAPKLPREMTEGWGKATVRSGAQTLQAGQSLRQRYPISVALRYRSRHTSATSSTSLPLSADTHVCFLQDIKECTASDQEYSDLLF